MSAKSKPEPKKEAAKKASPNKGRKKGIPEPGLAEYEAAGDALMKNLEIRAGFPRSKFGGNLVPVDLIAENPENPRSPIRIDPPWLELAQNILDKNGIRVPIKIRPHPEQEGKFVCVYGNRRLSIYKNFSLKERRELTEQEISQLEGKRLEKSESFSARNFERIPAEIVDLSDAEAFECTVAENQARCDLTPLQQANAVETFLKKYGGDRAEAAARLGMKKWEAEAAAIVGARLIEKWKEAAEKLDGATLSHLLKIARLPASAQEHLFEAIVNPWETKFPTLKQIDSRMDHCLHLLEITPFPKNDDIGEREACSGCQKRSDKNGRGMFDDFAGDKKALCLDATCWREKYEAWLEQTATEFFEKHPDGVCVSETGDAFSDMNCPLEVAGTLKSNPEASEEESDGEFQEVPENEAKEKGNIAALLLDGERIGKTIWVRDLREPEEEEEDSDSETEHAAHSKDDSIQKKKEHNARETKRSREDVMAEFIAEKFSLALVGDAHFAKIYEMGSGMHLVLDAEIKNKEHLIEVANQLTAGLGDRLLEMAIEEYPETEDEKQG